MKLPSGEVWNQIKVTTIKRGDALMVCSHAEIEPVFIHKHACNRNNTGWILLVRIWRVCTGDNACVLFGLMYAYKFKNCDNWDFHLMVIRSSQELGWVDVQLRPESSTSDDDFFIEAFIFPG